MRVLLVVTESPCWDEALAFADLTARSTGGVLTLVAVAPEPQAEEALRQALFRSLPRAAKAALSVRQGTFFPQVLNEISEGDYDLAVIAADLPAREGPPHIVPSTHLARLCGIPLAIVRSCPADWSRPLICARELDLSLPTIRTGTEIASRVGTQPVILNVTALPADEAEPPTGPAIPPETVAEVRTRRGHIVEEIRAEVKDGGHHIVVVGAHSVPAGALEPGPTLALPDLTRQILLLELPVVIVVSQVTAVLPEVERRALAARAEVGRIIRYVALELLIYAALVVAYAAVAFRLLVTPLETFFRSNLILYAVIALLLMVGQGTLLEALTSFLMDRLRFERFE